jgi:hypothetical protein
VQAVVPVAEAGRGVEVYRGLLCPGFINCHCHLELSHLRGVIPEGTGLVDFLSMVIRRRGGGPGRGRRPREGEPTEVRGEVDGSVRPGGGRRASRRCRMDNGIVAVSSLGIFVIRRTRWRQKRPGRMAYRNFIETMGFIESSAADRFAASRAVLEEFEGEISPGPIRSFRTRPIPFRRRYSG